MSKSKKRSERGYENQRAYQRAYYAKHRERLKAAASASAKRRRVEINTRARELYGPRYKAKKLATLYKAPVSEIQRLLAMTACEICDSAIPKELVVDHDHKTGLLRGRLCHKCNQGLGLFGDNPQRLTAAAVYLQRNGEVTA